MKLRGLVLAVVVLVILSCAALSFHSIKNRAEGLRITSLLKSIATHVLRSCEPELSDRWTEIPFDPDLHKGILDATKPRDVDAVVVYLRKNHGRREVKVIHAGRDGVPNSGDDITHTWIEPEQYPPKQEGSRPSTVEDGDVRRQ